MSTKARLIANLASGNTFSNAIATYLTANVVAGDFPVLGGDLTNTEGNTTVSLVTSGVTAGSYGNTTTIPVITVDAKGRITSATTNSVSGVTGVTWTAANSTVTVSTSTVAFSANIQAANATVQGLTTVLDSVTNTSITIAASANSAKNAYDRAIDANTRASSAQTAATSAYSNATTYAATIAGTAYSNAVSTAATDATTKAASAYTNAVSYAASNTYVNNTFAPKAGPTFTGTAAFTNVTISGNLTTSGTTTYVNTTNLNIGDNIITLNADLGASAPSENAGIEVNRGTSANVALRWYEAGDEWQTTVDGANYLKVATNNDVSTAYSNAIAYSGNAALAYANAVTYAGTIAGTAYSNAIAYSGNAALAYANAIAYSANASNISSGTLAFGRLPPAYIGTTAIQSSSASQALAGITTLAAGNTTVTGFANVTSTLQVGSNITAVGSINSNSAVSIYSTTPYVDFYQAGVQEWKIGQLTSTSSTLTIQATGATNADKITITPGGQFTVANNTAYTIFAAANGNIGIGTTSPAHQLHVYGNTTSDVYARITSIYADGYDAGVALENTHTGGRMYALVSTNNSRGTIGGGKFAIIDKTAGNSAHRFLIDSSGRVGISNVSPSHTLSVNGTSYFGSSVNVATTFAAGNTTITGTGAFSNNVTITDNKTSNTNLAVYNNNSSGGAAHLRVGYDATYHLDIFRLGNTADYYYNGTQSGASHIFQIAGTTTYTSNTSGVYPGADATQNLGSTSYRWNNIYTADAHFSNEGTEGNSVDGTTGNWTLQEGEEFIYMLNNKTGKRYKIKMEEV